MPNSEDPLKETSGLRTSEARAWKHSGFRASKRRSSSSYLTAPAKITESCSKSGETTTLLMPFFGTAKSYFPVFARPGAISITLFRTADNWLRVKFWEYCELVADALPEFSSNGVHLLFDSWRTRSTLPLLAA
jgi:hypothetical protein